MVAPEQSDEYNGEQFGIKHGLNPGFDSSSFFEVFCMRMSSRVIGGVVVAALLSQLTACGSIFFPDRRGQIDGKIDPMIAVLDAVGLLFYVIPGLIAFGVDFATGAIYFPPGKTAQIAPDKVDNSKLQAILESELGRSFPLDDPRLIQHKGSVQQLAMYGLIPAA
jgi:hypothetical protein